MRSSSLVFLVALAVPAAGCDGCQGTASGPSAAVPASSDPQGADLVPGAVVAAEEKGGGMRLYKIVKINWFPDPVGEELEMIAYEQKGSTFADAARLWEGGRLTVALPKVRVAKHRFVLRDHRVLVREDVSQRELDAKAGDPQRSPADSQPQPR